MPKVAAVAEAKRGREGEGRVGQLDKASGSAEAAAWKGGGKRRLSLSTCSLS